ncbi:hypothetical protein, partial [Ectothiorhodospira haloalkaliphila]
MPPPLPYWFDIFIVSETKARSIHLAFAVLLAFLAFPAVNPMARMRPLAGYFFILVGLGLWGLAGYQVWHELPRAGVFAAVGAGVLLAA